MFNRLRYKLHTRIMHWTYRRDQLAHTGSLRAILDTDPIVSDDQAPVDLFFLAGPEDLYPLLIAAKSLYWWSGMKFRVLVGCDDCKLPAEHRDIVRKYIPGVHILDNRAEVLDKLSKYPATTRFHLDHTDPSYAKLTLPALYARKDKVIVMDTDVIFYRKPELLMAWASNPDDKRDLYRNPWLQPFPFPALEEEIKSTFHITDRLALESGLLLCQRDLLDLDALETATVLYEKHGFTRWTKELELYNVLFRIRNQHDPLPRDDYGEVWNYDGVAVHYYSREFYSKSSVLHTLSLIEFIKKIEAIRREEAAKGNKASV